MIETNTAVFAGMFVFLGAFAFVTARKTHTRYSDLTDLTDPTSRNADRTETALEGPVDVSDPAVPDRRPPAELNTEVPVALWAWRIRRKVKKSAGDRNQTTWRTVESGLAAGEFTIKDGWESVYIDTATITIPQDGRLQSDEDPFEAEHLYLGEPEEDIRIGDPDPLTKRLEDWGILGENGLLSDFELTVSFGRKTLSPDRYQATLVRDGEELLVSGELNETQEDAVLRGTEETPMIVATSNHDQTAEKLYSTARKQAVAGVVLVLIGVGFLASGFF